ncbi:hypothetical protein Dimus_022068 [Dionaea muscipula]
MPTSIIHPFSNRASFGSCTIAPWAIREDWVGVLVTVATLEVDMALLLVTTVEETNIIMVAGPLQTRKSNFVL